uniref:Uncharacterized protein n=1 Tax=Corvus moneduloides TaxID=1196302 RepID=A0A8C3D485_CORMO
MSNSCGSPEDAGKQRGRDGKIRREDVDDSQPEGKRLKLGNEGGNSGKDREASAAEDAIMPCSSREEPVPEGGGEGKSVSEDLQRLRERGKGREVTFEIICHPEVGNWASSRVLLLDTSWLLPSVRSAGGGWWEQCLGCRMFPL